jgi:hypothetical protein
MLMKLKKLDVILEVVVFKIKLLVLTYEDGTTCPTSLQINDKTYTYGEDNLFEKLTNYIDSEIEIFYSGFKNYTKRYIIEEVILEKIPKLQLKDIDESLI